MSKLIKFSPMNSKTVVSKFTEVVTEGRKFHIKFSDVDLKFEVVEFVQKKKWYKDKPVEEPQVIYTGTSEMFQDITRQMLYDLNNAMRDRREQVNKEILGMDSFSDLLETIKRESQKRIM